MLPFRFKSELWTAQYTGVKAATLGAFILHIKEADPDTIYYHLYRNLFEYHFLPTDFPNSFAYWLAENGFHVLAEKFSAVDITEYTSLKEVKDKLVALLEESPDDRERVCKPFYFIRAVRSVINLGISAGNLSELIDGIRKAGIYSLFYHLVSSRLVSREATNDFSRWLSDIGEDKKAQAIESIDLSTMSLYEAKDRIIEILEGEKW